MPSETKGTCCKACEFFVTVLRRKCEGCNGSGCCGACRTCVPACEACGSPWDGSERSAICGAVTNADVLRCRSLRLATVPHG